MLCFLLLFIFFFKQKTAYEMRISDWSSDVCSSDLRDDVAVDDALIAVLRAGLVALLGVVLHELLAQLGHRGRLARLGLGATGVAAPANLGQPVLCLNSCLFDGQLPRSEEHTSELQSLIRNSYAVFCLKKKKTPNTNTQYS